MATQSSRALFDELLADRWHGAEHACVLKQGRPQRELLCPVRVREAGRVFEAERSGQVQD